MSVGEPHIIGIVSHWMHRVDPQRLCFLEGDHLKQPSTSIGLAVLNALFLFFAGRTRACRPEFDRGPFASRRIAPLDLDPTPLCTLD